MPNDDGMQASIDSVGAVNNGRQQEDKEAASGNIENMDQDASLEDGELEEGELEDVEPEPDEPEKKQEEAVQIPVPNEPPNPQAATFAGAIPSLLDMKISPPRNGVPVMKTMPRWMNKPGNRKRYGVNAFDDSEDDNIGEELMKMKKMRKRKPEEKTKPKYIDHDRTEVNTEDLDYAELLWGMSKKASKSRRPVAVSSNSPPGPYDSPYASRRGPYDSPSPPANLPGPYDSPSSDDEHMPAGAAAARELLRHDGTNDNSVAVATNDSSVAIRPTPTCNITSSSVVAQKPKLPSKSVTVDRNSDEDNEASMPIQAFRSNHGLPAKKDAPDVSVESREPAAKEPQNVIKEYREPSGDATTFKHYHQGPVGHHLQQKWSDARDDGGGYKGGSATGVASPELPPLSKRRRLIDTPFEERPICRFYLEGKCAKGYECQFNHDCELPKKPYLCRFYRAGNCNKGKDCVYYHETWPCRHFHKGTCAAGDACRFSHAELTDETKLIVEKMAAEEDSVEETVKNPPPQQLKKKSLLGDYPNPQLLAVSMTMNAGDKRKAIPSLFDLPFVSMPTTSFPAAGTSTSSLSSANSTRPPMPGFMPPRMASQSQPGLLGAPPPLPSQMTVVRLIQMRMGLIPTVPFTGLAMAPGGPRPSKLPGNELSYTESQAAGFETGDAANNEMTDSVAEISIKDDNAPPSSSVPSTASIPASTSLAPSSSDVVSTQGNVATSAASSQPAQTSSSPMAVNTSATSVNSTSAPTLSQSAQHVSSLAQPMASMAQPFQQMAQPVAQPFQQMAMSSHQMASLAQPFQPCMAPPIQQCMAPPTQQLLTSNSMAPIQPLLSIAQTNVSFPQRTMQPPTQPLIVAGVDLSQLPPLQRDVFLRLHQFNSQQQQQQSLSQQNLPPQPQQPSLQQPLSQQPFQLQSRPQDNGMFSSPPPTSVHATPAVDMQSKLAPANSAVSSANPPRLAAPSAGGDVVDVLKLLQQQPPAGNLPRLPLAPVFNINQVLSAISKSMVPPSTAATAELTTAASATADDTSSTLEVNGCRAQIDYVVHPYDCGGTVIPLHVNIDDSKWDEDPRVQRWRREVELGRMPRREAPRVLAPKPPDAAPHRDPRIKATDAPPPSSQSTQFQLQQQQLQIQQLVQQLMQQNSRQPMPTGLTTHLPPIFAMSQMPQTSVNLAMTSGHPMLPVSSGFIPHADVRVPPPLFRPSVATGTARQVVPLMSLTLNSSIGQQFMAANSAAAPAAGFATPQVVPVTEQVPSTASSGTPSSSSSPDNPISSTTSAVSEPGPISASSVAEDVITVTSSATDSEESSENSLKVDYRNDPRFKKRKVAGGAPKKTSNSSQENESNQMESSNDDAKITSERNKDVLMFQSPLAVANDARPSKSSSGYNRPPNKRYQELLDQNNQQPRTDHRRNQFGVGDSSKSTVLGGGFAGPRAPLPVLTPSAGTGLYPVILPPDSSVSDSEIEGSLKDMFKTIDPTASPFC